LPTGKHGRYYTKFQTKVKKKAKKWIFFATLAGEDRRQKTDDRRQKTDDRRQKTDDRRQMTDDRRQMTDGRRQMTDKGVRPGANWQGIDGG